MEKSTKIIHTSCNNSNIIEVLYKENVNISLPAKPTPFQETMLSVQCGDVLSTFPYAFYKYIQTHSHMGLFALLFFTSVGS